jgi:hypothetical protein
MSKLRLGLIEDEKPVRVTVELSSALHRDLVRYGEAIGRESGGGPVPPLRLIEPMLARFISSDRAFAKLRHAGRTDGAASSRA